MLVFYVGIFAEMKVIGAIFVNGITFSRFLFSVPAIFFCYFYSPLHMMIGVMINFYEAVTWKKNKSVYLGVVLWHHFIEEIFGSLNITESPSLKKREIVCSNCVIFNLKSLLNIQLL